MFKTLSSSVATHAGALTVFALVGAAHAGGGSITLNPANNIQATINSGNFSEIVLAPGTYNQTITIDSGDGPLTIRSQDPSDLDTVTATIIDGQFLGTSVILCTSGVVSDVVIDGITIRNGEALGASGPADRGGAIDCETASPTVRRCVLMSSHADSVGGAVYVNAGAPIFEDCLFVANDAEYGGAVYANNSSTTFTRCTFHGNDATFEGGGVRVVGGSGTFTQCVFLENECVTFGGAITTRTTALLKVTQCLFRGNFSGDGGSNGRGGAIYHDGNDASTVDNSVFWNNSCSNFGSSIYTLQNITLRNNTHYGDTGNDVIDVPSGGRIDMYNSIVWNYSGNTITGSGTRNVQYCNIEGGYAGTGNIGADSGDEPTFADVAVGDFHLLEGSAGIDAGDATKVLGQYPVDFDDNARVLNDLDTPDSGVAVVGLSVDMGAFEFQPEGIAPPNTCLADIVNSGTFQPPADGLVDGADLAYLLGAWGSCR